MVNNRTIGSTTPTTIRKAVMGLTFFAVFIDGFDTAILALLVPHLADEWGVGAAAFTYPLVLTSVGVVVGYLGCGALALRFGQKRALVFGVVLFGIATLMSAATLHLQSMGILSATRTITGIGLGIVAPVAIVIGTQNGPSEKRQSIAVFITTGLISGATIAGFSGAPLIDGLGTAGVLWLAGVVPIVLAVLLAFFIPNSPIHIERDNTSNKSAAAVILGPGLRTSTLVLWTATFLVFVVSYTLKSWLPTLFEDFGMPRSTAGLGLAFFGLGGMGGGLMLIVVSARFGAARSLVVMSLIGALATAAVALLPVNTAALMILICIAGAGITACSIGQAAIAVSIYEMSIRTKGVGWSAACGRIGSIVGPAIAGVLLGFAWPARDIVLLVAFPIVITTVCWLILSKRVARTDHETVEPAGDQPTLTARGL